MIDTSGLQLRTLGNRAREVVWGITWGRALTGHSGGEMSALDTVLVSKERAVGFDT